MTNRQRGYVQLSCVIQQRTPSVRRHSIDFPIVAGAQINVALCVERAGPDKGLLSVKYLGEVWSQHQHACVGYRNAARIPLQQFSPTYLPQITGWPARTS